LQGNGCHPKHAIINTVFNVLYYKIVSQPLSCDPAHSGSAIITEKCESRLINKDYITPMAQLPLPVRLIPTATGLTMIWCDDRVPTRTTKTEAKAKEPTLNCTDATMPPNGPHPVTL
jgi:hypothetical protein